MNESNNGAAAASLIGLSFPAAILVGTVLGSPGLAVLVLIGMWAGAFTATA